MSLSQMVRVLGQPFLLVVALRNAQDAIMLKLKIRIWAVNSIKNYSIKFAQKLENDHF